MQARIGKLSATHELALRELNERLDGAAESIAQLECRVRSEQGELADLEARARALHHDLQVGALLRCCCPGVRLHCCSPARVDWQAPRARYFVGTQSFLSGINLR